MKRLLKNSIYVFIIAAILIAVSQAYEAKDSVLSPEYPDKIAGVLGQEKLDNLKKQWNEIGKAEGYKVGGEYRIEKGMTGEIVRIDLNIALMFDYPQRAGEYRDKVNAITGKIAIGTAKIFKPLNMLTIALIYLPGESPGIDISALTMKNKQIDELGEQDMENWTMETYANAGRICIPPGEPLPSLN